MDNRELREQMCDICYKMWQLGWAAANDGNLSVKLSDGTYLATPTGISKSFITPEKLVHIDADAIAPYLQEHDALLLANYGALTLGADALTAYYRMETLELSAKISLNAHLIGGEVGLPKERIDQLIKMRESYGITGKHPGYKHYRREEES